jgi:hypothetical protein
MLKTLDIVIGLSVVMLLVSMAVTVLTQCVIGLRNWRGKHLLTGIETILAQIDPNLRVHAKQIGEAVLTHPLIGPATGKLSGVIFRGEMVRALMDLAAGNVPAPVTKPGFFRVLLLWFSGEKGQQELATGARQALTDALKNGGIDHPDRMLDNIHAAALKLEATNPELSAAVRHTTAIIQEAPGVFVARLNAWFDQSMDRVTESFVYNTRKITVVCSILVVFGLQLDSLDLLKRLSRDEELRKAIGAQATKVMDAYSATKTDTEEQRKQAIENTTKQLKEFSVTGYDIWPNEWTLLPGWDKVPGMLLSTLLLSLGAPFWFNALKNLVNLRPLLAGKEDAARDARSAAQPKAPATGPPPGASSEQGDLSAAG